MQKKISLLVCTLFVAFVLMAQNRTQPPPPPPLAPVEKHLPPLPGKEQVDIPQDNQAIENMRWSESGKKLQILYKGGRTEVYNLQTNSKGDKIIPGVKIPPPPPPVPPVEN